jgi:dCMP deaminase
MLRKSYQKYFMEMAELVSTRSTCIRRNVGAVIVNKNRVISTGYNGVPKNMEHCTNETCIRNKNNIPSGERHELCLGVHAEQNAIIFANRYDLQNAEIYITTHPCAYCAKSIINAGIKKIYYKGDYEDELSKKLLSKSGVKLIKIS